MDLITVFKGVATVAGVAKPVVEAVGGLMAAAEAGGAAGATKKEAVVAGVRAFVIALGVNWDTLAALISTLIDSAKAFYNLIVASNTPEPA